MTETSYPLPMEAAEKVLAAAEGAGVARAALLTTVGAGESAAEIDYSSLCALYEQAARLTRDEYFGLHVGEATSPRMYGPLGYIVANSACLGDALASLVDYQALWSGAVVFELSVERGVARLRYRHRGRIPPSDRRQESEQMLVALLAFMRHSAGAAVEPKSVRFEHSAPGDIAEHRRIFGAPLVFGASSTEMDFDAVVLSLPIAEADPTLGKLLRTQASAKLAKQERSVPFVERLRGQVKATILGAGPTTMAVLGAAMKVGPRTLQRRLSEHGLTFREVVEGVRVEMARDMLEQRGMPLARIAFQLGYSQVSAFHRAFRRHAGMTPGEFRRRATAGEQHFRH